LIPLDQGNSEPIVDLHPLLDEIYDQASFDLVIDYTLEPVPPLREGERDWVNKLLQEQDLRNAVIDEIFPTQQEAIVMHPSFCPSRL
jgi:hypothetical protein